VSRTCALPGCDRDLTGRRSNTRYCTPAHRLEAFRLRDAHGDQGEGTRAALETFHSPDPLADNDRETFRAERSRRRAGQRARTADRILRDFDWLLHHAGPHDARAVLRQQAEMLKARVGAPLEVER
jgi:hypothetical protein